MPIKDSLMNLIIIGPFSLNIEVTSLLQSGKKTISISMVLVPTSSSIFELPPKLKGMMNTLTPLSSPYTSLDLILNDSFVIIIKEKKKNGTFDTLYDYIVIYFIKGKFIF